MMTAALRIPSVRSRSCPPGQPRTPDELAGGKDDDEHCNDRPHSGPLSPRSTADAMNEPGSGSLRSLFITEMASLCATKNHPPPKDIIEFQNQTRHQSRYLDRSNAGSDSARKWMRLSACPSESKPVNGIIQTSCSSGITTSIAVSIKARLCSISWAASADT